MYTLGRQTGYSSDANNDYLSFLDYLPTVSWGYSKSVANNFNGLIDYIENREYYSCSAISIQDMTWEIWGQNWEVIDTNWNK